MRLYTSHHKRSKNPLEFQFLIFSNTKNELSPSKNVTYVASMLSEFHLLPLFNGIECTKSASHRRNFSFVCSILHPHFYTVSF